MIARTDRFLPVGTITVDEALGSGADIGQAKITSPSGATETVTIQQLSPPALTWLVPNRGQAYLAVPAASPPYPRLVE